MHNSESQNEYIPANRTAMTVQATHPDTAPEMHPATPLETALKLHQVTAPESHQVKLEETALEQQKFRG